MSVFSLLAQHADMAVHNLHVAGTMVSDAALHGKLAVEHASDHLVVLAQADSGPITVDQFKEKLKEVQQEEQLGWLTAIGKYFIGIFQKGGEVFAGFVTGIIPTLVVLMTAFYAVTELVGEERVHGLARGAGRIALTRYTLLPLLAVFFLTNPMAYTFGSFLEEKHKPAFYDAAVSYVHPRSACSRTSIPANTSSGAAFWSLCWSWKRRVPSSPATTSRWRSGTPSSVSSSSCSRAC